VQLRIILNKELTRAVFASFLQVSRNSGAQRQVLDAQALYRAFGDFIAQADPEGENVSASPGLNRRAAPAPAACSARAAARPTRTASRPRGKTIETYL
jgi:hypothetical protein